MKKILILISEKANADESLFWIRSFLSSWLNTELDVSTISAETLDVAAGWERYLENKIDESDAVILSTNWEACLYCRTAQARAYEQGIMIIYEGEIRERREGAEIENILPLKIQKILGVENGAAKPC